MGAMLAEVDTQTIRAMGECTLRGSWCDGVLSRDGLAPEPVPMFLTGLAEHGEVRHRREGEPKGGLPDITADEVEDLDELDEAP